jgi:hypothetical protein
MFLQEEYLKRHGLDQDVHIVNYVTNGSVLLKTAGNSYVLMRIKWEDHPRRPGKFEVTFLAPVHNGYVNSCFFDTILPDSTHILEWDHYLNHLIIWSKGVQATPVCGDIEVILAIWQIFIYGCDEYLASNMTFALEELISISINESKSISDRFSAYQNALVLISTSYPDLLRLYKHDLLPRISNYCQWLATLIKKCQNDEVSSNKDN